MSSLSGSGRLVVIDTIWGHTGAEPIIEIGLIRVMLIPTLQPVADPTLSTMRSCKRRSKLSWRNEEALLDATAVLPKKRFGRVITECGCNVTPAPNIIMDKYL